MSQSVVEGLVEGVGGVEARRLVLMLYGVFASVYRELYSLVEGFDEALSWGVVDVDEYYREAVVRSMYLDVYFLAGRLNEVLVRHPELLRGLPGAAPAQSPDVLYRLLAGVLFRIACGFEGPRRGVSRLGIRT